MKKYIVRIDQENVEWVSSIYQNKYVDLSPSFKDALEVDDSVSNIWVFTNSPFYYLVNQDEADIICAMTQ